MKKRLLACLLTAAMLVSLFPLPALAAEAERPEWMVTAFDPLDGDIAAQTVPQGGEPVLPDSLTAWAYVIEDDTAVIPPTEGLTQEDEQPQTDGPEEAEDNQLPSDSTGEPFAPLTEAMVENELEPAEKQEPDIQPVTIPGVTWEAQPEADPATPGQYVYTPVLPAAYEVAGEVELPVISVTVTAAEQTALQRVQALIDALPDTESITPDNAEDAAARLAAIDEASETLTKEERAALDFTRYEAVMLTLAALMDDTPTFFTTESNISYLDCDTDGKNWTTKTCSNATVVDSSTTEWTDGWYVVNSGDAENPLKIDSRVTVTGNVHLILADGFALIVNGGISIADSSSLTVYGQTAETGVLTAAGNTQTGVDTANGAITINGGTVNAIGSAGSDSGFAGFAGIDIANGTLTVNHGTVNVTGGNGGSRTNGDGFHGGNGGAGIASAGGSITIHNGTVNITGGSGGGGSNGSGYWDSGGNGGNGGAGIASTDGTITIDSGIVNAAGGVGGDGGIGNNGGDGDGGDGGTGIASISGSITIHSGTVNITGGTGGNVGGRYSNAGGDGGSGIANTSGSITIHSGTVNTTGGVSGQGASSDQNGTGIDGAFSTGTGGTALILASSISGNEDTSKWGGIIFEGKEGQVYGDQTLQNDFELPDDHTLTIPADTTLTVPENVALTNNGTLINDGTLANNSEVINDGTLINNGSITNIDAIKGKGTIYDVTDQPSGDSVSYWTCDQSGQNWKLDERHKYTVVEVGTIIWGINYGKEQWYVVNSDVEISDRITVSGDVHLILVDGCTLTAKNGIQVQGSDNSLTIYAQSLEDDTMGRLSASISNGYNAAIGSGGGVITINGGAIDAKGGYRSAGIGGGQGSTGGVITINGGKVIATGGDYSGSGGYLLQGGAGIGSGRKASGGIITINGGDVAATGNGGGAGIGGGGSGTGGTITITGGTVNATGSSGGAGIGDGNNSSGSTFNTGKSGNAFIMASSISDQSDKDSWSGVIFEGNEGQVYGTPTLETDATIPGGKTLTVSEGKKLTIGEGATLTNSGTIVNSGEISGNLINNGTICTYGTLGGSLTNDGTIVNSGEISGDLINNGTICTYGTLGGSLTNDGTIMVGPDGSIPETVPGTGSVVRYPSNGTYLDKDGNSKSIPTGTKFLLPGMTALSGWYVVCGNVTLTERPTVTGDVHLILVDGCKLDAKQGITVSNGNSLTIYAQSNGENMGALTATADDYDAGIGGSGRKAGGGNITINGGAVNATGGYYGAGIGGGDSGAGGTITISGGTVTATGGYGGAGIGGGDYGAGGTITISGGTVTATGDGGGAGIGGGNRGDGGDIAINGGAVTATGGSSYVYAGAGIGGGDRGDGGTITISGGTVTATGGSGDGGYAGAGIGGGDGGEGGTITISGGTVTATGGSGDGVTAAGIGNGGKNEEASTFTTGDDGNAFIIASSISGSDDTAGWSGAIFVGDEGQVYGDPILGTDATVPGDKTLEIPAGTTLTIDSGVTLTNDGEITNNGTLTINISGKLVNNGTLVNNSSNQGITGNGTIQGGGKLTGDGKIAGSITIDLPTVPTITEQPQAKTVSAGETVKFTVTASGNPAPTYQWQVNKGSGWGNILDATNISYTTEAADMSMNGWQYRCVAANSEGSATSDPATLTVQKGVPPAAAPQHLNIANHLAKTYTYLLSNLRPQLPEGTSWENVTYELTDVAFTQGGYYTADTATIIPDPSGALNILSLPILFNDVTVEGQVGTITVTIRSDNYQDFTNTLEIIASNKETVKFSGVTGVTVPYTGQPVTGYTGELVIQDSDGGTVAPDLEISYTGRLETSYKGTQPPTEMGTYSVIFRVADTDPKYIGRLAVNFEITKAQGGGGDPVNPGGGSGGYTPPTTTYPPTVEKPSGGGGTAVVSPSNPKQGDTVTVTPKPDEGYEVDKITVTDKNGKPVEVTVKPDGTYTFKQPNGKVKIEVTYQPIDRPWNNPFTDVSEGDWYYEAVRFVQERGLMNGYSDGRFWPNDNLSRAQLAQILFNKEGRPGTDYLLDFSDVAGEAWYTEAVRWATSQGIVNGYGNGTFGPDDPITREQLAVMLWRYSGSPAATNKELHFNDESETSGFALEALRWAVENGILNGYGDGRLGPQGQATRAQVAQMLKNFIEYQEETI